MRWTTWLYGPWSPEPKACNSNIGGSSTGFLGTFVCNFSRFLACQKTILSVELFCPKCRQKVMKVISDVVGITSIVLDPSKNTVTVTGEADPFKIIKKVRKFRKHASIVSIGAAKDEKKDEKKDDRKDVTVCTPKTCQRCDVWYVVSDDFYSYCSIL